LQAKASRHAIIGVLISGVALLSAVLLSSYFQFGAVSLDGIVHVQQNNMVLWFMDGMPLLFAVWGQLGGSMVTREAGTMIMNQTQKFMAHTEMLESRAALAATHDALTGLPNRILFRERLDQALAEAQAQGKGLALMVFDLDHFKEVNDTLGYVNGDRILQRVAARLNREIEVDDTLARMGGDEFALLLPEIGRDGDVRRLADRLLQALARPLPFAGLNLDLRMSIGAAVFPEHGQDADTLLMRADMAMYVAKIEGGCYQEYAPGIDRYSHERLILMGELRQAAGRGELFVQYQPKVDSRSGRITDAEALLRWAHPRQGLLEPGLFIPMAERTGLIKELSLWVLETVIAQIAAWQHTETEQKIRISVNLSARDLLDLELPMKLAVMLHRHGVAPERLILEITETMLIVDPERALGILHRFSGMGVGISIDDFGIGYSSLSYLRQMPADEIKIDRSFVLEMLNNSNDAVIVQAAISLAHNLGLKVVAEGVESREVAEKLMELGCDVMQGFHFSKPVSAEDFCALISSDLSTRVH
jgi:diguanylate cyclase (GGDEF)-like protein